MGKGEDDSGNQSSDEESNPKEEPSKDIEEKTDESGEQKQNVDELRKVIKVDQEEKPEKEEEPVNEEQQSDDTEPPTRESLEQKRAILQSIKDFDFQIKKNSEEITSIFKKLESVSKDLDDLVSLYEIVSEQMNPFVGLSKVTKKRIDALENFTKEIDELKERVGDIESFTEKAGVDFAEIKALKDTTPTVTKKEKSPEQPTKISQEFSTDDFDYIIEQSFQDINIDLEIDNVIDDFIEKLKV
jgi:flagellar protein FlaC